MTTARVCPALELLTSLSSPRVTVIRPGGLGDTLLVLPTLQWLQERLSHAALTLVGSSWAEKLLPLVLAPPQFVPFDSRELAPLFVPRATEPLPPALGQADGVVLYTADPKGPLAENLRRGCRGPAIIWPAAPAPGLHAAVHFAAAVAEGRATPSAVRLSVPEEARQWAREWLRSRIGGDGSFVIVHAGSGGRAKCWPAAAFATVLVRLDKPAVLLEGPADAEPSRRLRSLMASDQPLAVAADLAIGEFAALLERCSLFVGNDSGVSHLAAALGVPTIAVFGATDPSVWAPLGHRVVTVGGMGNWPVPDEVIEAAESLLR